MYINIWIIFPLHCINNGLLPIGTSKTLDNICQRCTIMIFQPQRANFEWKNYQAKVLNQVLVAFL